MNAHMRSIEQLARWDGRWSRSDRARGERAWRDPRARPARPGARRAHRRRCQRAPSAWLARGALVLLGAATLALVLHLAGDDFGYRYAWLYSAAELPLYLKVANLWGGEEGTLLLMATLLALAACRLVDARVGRAPERCC